MGMGRAGDSESTNQVLSPSPILLSSATTVPRCSRRSASRASAPSPQNADVVHHPIRQRMAMSTIWGPKPKQGPRERVQQGGVQNSGRFREHQAARFNVRTRSNGGNRNA